jgi:hypothetical protein
MDGQQAMKIADRIAHAADLVAARNRWDGGRGEEKVCAVQVKQQKAFGFEAIVRGVSMPGRDTKLRSN